MRWGRWAQAAVVASVDSWGVVVVVVAHIRDREEVVVVDCCYRVVALCCHTGRTPVREWMLSPVDLVVRDLSYEEEEDSCSWDYWGHYLCCCCCSDTPLPLDNHLYMYY